MQPNQFNVNFKFNPPPNQPSPCPFKVADLKGKTVKFRVPMDPSGVLEGIGTFDAREHQGRIQVAINYVQMSNQGALGNRIFIPTEELHNIIRNPSGSEADFTLMAV